MSELGELGMLIVICVIASYILIGLGMVLSDLNSSPLERPMWALKPTFTNSLLILLSWPLRSFNVYALGNPTRGIVFCIVLGSIHVAIVSVIAWLSYVIPHHWIDSEIVSAVIAVVVFFVSSIFLLPFASILLALIAMPLTALLSIAFPARPNRE